MSMLLELPADLEARIRDIAKSEGVSVSDLVGRLVTEASARRTQLAAFHEAIHERMASIRAGEVVDGEETMARLIAELG